MLVNFAEIEVVEVRFDPERAEKGVLPKVRYVNRSILEIFIQQFLDLKDDLETRFRLMKAQLTSASYLRCCVRKVFESGLERLGSHDDRRSVKRPSYEFPSETWRYQKLIIDYSLSLLADPAAWPAGSSSRSPSFSTFTRIRMVKTKMATRTNENRMRPTTFAMALRSAILPALMTYCQGRLSLRASRLDSYQ